MLPDSPSGGRIHLTIANRVPYFNDSGRPGGRCHRPQGVAVDPAIEIQTPIDDADDFRDDSSEPDYELELLSCSPAEGGHDLDYTIVENEHNHNREIHSLPAHRITKK